MDYDKFGICLTIAIVVGVLGYAGLVSGEFGIDIEIPTLTGAQVSTDTGNTDVGSSNAYYEWCYKMNLECK